MANANLDLGTDSGQTVLNCIKVLRTRVPRLDVALVDAVPAMLQYTTFNLQHHQLLQDYHIPVKFVHHCVKGYLTTYPKVGS